MTSMIPFLVEKGVFEQDPDDFLWLSAGMKDVIRKLEENEEFLDQLKEIKDPEDRSIERWVTIYLAFTGGARTEETVKVVKALVAWEAVAMDRKMDEWSMKLRLS